MTGVLVFLSLLMNVNGDGNINQDDILQTWLLTDHTQSRFTFGDNRGDVLKFITNGQLEFHNLRNGEMKTEKYVWDGINEVRDEAGKLIMEIKSLGPTELVLRRYVMNENTRMEEEMIYHPISKTVTKYDKQELQQLLTEYTWESRMKGSREKTEMIIQIGGYRGKNNFQIQQKIEMESQLIVAPGEIHEIEGYFMIRIHIPNDIEGLALEYLGVENHPIKKMTENELIIDIGFPELSTFRRL